MAKTNQQIIVTEGDFGIEILTQFIDANKKPVPIEGCSCKVKFAYDGNVITEKTGVVIDEPKGIVSVILDKEETQYSGLWTSYWICYDQFNNITTTENIYYYVQPAIGSVNNPAFAELLNYYNRDEVNNMFKNILEQLNNHTLSKDDVEEYIKIYVRDNIGEDFIKQCVLDALGDINVYAKKEEVEEISLQLETITTNKYILKSSDNLIDIVKILKTKQSIILDDGIYVIKEPLVLNDLECVHITSNGQATIRLEGEGDVITLNNCYGTVFDNIKIESTGNNKGSGLVLNSSTRTILNKCLIWNVDYNCINMADSFWTTANNCVFDRGSVTTSNYEVLSMGKNSNNILIDHCRFYGRNGNMCINISGGNNITINSCDISGALTKNNIGINCNSALNVNIINNYFEDNKIAVQIGDNIYSVGYNLENNYLSLPTSENEESAIGFNIIRCGYLNIDGNTFLGTGTSNNIVGINIADDNVNKFINVTQQNYFTGIKTRIVNNFKATYNATNKVFYSTSKPKTGSFSRGDVVLNTYLAEVGTDNKYIIYGWACVETGEPGTWKELRVYTGGSPSIIKRTYSPNISSDFIGQIWIDTTNKTSYIAIDCGQVSDDWKQITI